MKKLFLPILLLSFLTTSFAQQQEVKTYYYADNDDMYVSSFDAVSDNGTYVLGNHPTLYYTFYLNTQTGEITRIEYDGAVVGKDISNDGVIVGSFDDPTAIVYDAGKPVICRVPGIYKDGQWKALDRLPGASLNGGGFDGNATCISADGKLIGGYLPSIQSAFRYVPVIWNENGNIIKQLPTTGKNAGAKINFMSNDGSVACGWLEDAMYGQVAIWKNDELVSLPAGTGSGLYVTPNGIFVGGMYTSAVGDARQDPFIWSENTGLVNIENHEDATGSVTSISDNGRIIIGYSNIGKDMSNHRPFIVVDDKFYDLDEYMNDTYEIQGPLGASFFTPGAMSADGSVICGYSFIDNARSPWVLVFSQPESIENTNAQAVNVTLNASSDEIRIEGEYASANVYNQTGVCVASDMNAAGAINVSNLPKGIYFVKVADGKSTETYKVAK